MKNLMIKSLFALCLFFLTGSLAQAQNNCLNEHQAIARARQQCPNAPNPAGNGYYEAYLVATPLCTEGSEGCAMVWDVWFIFTCNPPQGAFCRPAPPMKIATVVENCDGTRVVTCEG